jgi:hypothetical protein
MVHPAEPSFKRAAPARPHLPLLPAVRAFAALVRATDAHDYPAATVARKLLRRHGWSCAPCSPKGGAG